VKIARANACERGVIERLDLFDLHDPCAIARRAVNTA
jgi:hypothetical protein